MRDGERDGHGTTLADAAQQCPVDPGVVEHCREVADTFDHREPRRTIGHARAPLIEVNETTGTCGAFDQSAVMMILPADLDVLSQRGHGDEPGADIADHLVRDVHTVDGCVVRPWTFGSCRSDHRGVGPQSRVLRQDTVLQILRLCRRNYPQRVAEHHAQPGQGAERVGLPTGAVQRLGNEDPWSFAQRVLGHRELAVGDYIGVAPE